MIRTMNAIELRVNFPVCDFPGLVRFANMVNLRQKYDVVFGLFEEDMPIGAGVLLTKGGVKKDCLELVYMVVAEFRRRSGFAKQLLEWAMAYAKNAGLDLTMRLVKGGVYESAIKKLIEKKGFLITDTSRIFHCKANESTKQIWKETKKRYADGLCAWFDRQGFSSICFEEADDDLKTYAFDEKKGGFDQGFGHLEIVSGMHGKFLEKLSSIAINSSKEPVALSMLLEGDRQSVVFQLTSVAEAYKNTGIIILPIVFSMDQIFQSQYETVYFCINDSNQPMRRVAQQLFGNLQDKEIQQFSYTYRNQRFH